ncbi:MAG TPA: nucleotide exchange factor GrpE, partial [Solirubrobacteraceae bacterium]
GDVEAGADSGHDENRSVEPQEPVAASVGEDAEEDAQVGEDAEGEAEDPAVCELRAQVAELTQSLAAAQRRADELATVARKQTEMADELHADNRRLRDGEIREAVAPLVRGLARLADDLSRMRATAAAESDDLAYLDGQVAELLHDAGVLTVQAQIGDPFDPQRHQAAGSATTADSALDRTIAEVRRAGLRREDGRMLRPVDVVVFRYVAPAPPAARPATEEVT